MSQKKISSGVVHEVPADLKKALTSDPQVLTELDQFRAIFRIFVIICEVNPSVSIAAL